MKINSLQVLMFLSIILLSNSIDYLKKGSKYLFLAYALTKDPVIVENFRKQLKYTELKVIQDEEEKLMMVVGYESQSNQITLFFRGAVNSSNFLNCLNLWKSLIKVKNCAGILRVHTGILESYKKLKKQFKVYLIELKNNLMWS